ncbi:MAG: hypothetical protein JNK05_38535 [Myxococcales bacterium]|nr:hypothetical protein [Myxococcales bacterium]
MNARRSTVLAALAIAGAVLGPLALGAPARAQRRPPRPRPEPSPPRVECTFSEQTRCFEHTPTRRALQPPPFVFCAMTRARVDGSTRGVDPPLQFSYARTARARLRTPDVCCYVEYTAQMCR